MHFNKSLVYQNTNNTGAELNCLLPLVFLKNTFWVHSIFLSWSEYIIIRVPLVGRKKKNPLTLHHEYSLFPETTFAKSIIRELNHDYIKDLKGLTQLDAVCH